MKKSLILGVCMMLLAIEGFSQGAYTSMNNNTGFWTDPIWTPEFGWMATQPSATDVSGSYTMNIYGYVTVDGDLSVTGSGRLEVYDTLVIRGDLNMTTSNGIYVHPGGVLVVVGDFTSTGGGNKINVAGSGRVAIVGEYEQQQGDVTTGNAYYIYDTTPNFTTGGCNGGASVDAVIYTCPPPNTAQLTDLLDTYDDLAANDVPFKEFIEGLGVICGFYNDVPVTNAQTVCSGSTPATLAGNAVSGTITYLWESSTTSATTGFANAAGTRTNQNYSPASVTQTTWFRRKVTRSGCTNTSGAITISILPNGTWTGGTSSVWTTGANWCGGVPSTTTDAIVPVTASGRYPSVSAVANCRDLLIQTGASVAVSSSTLNIYGNLTNNGTFTPSTSGSNVVAFRGTAQQTVTGGPYAFYSLTINNSAGAQVVFQNDVTVSNTMTLTAGKVNLSGRKLTLGTAGNSLGTLANPVGTGAGFMNGTFERWVPSNASLADADYRGYFPMATATNTRPFYVAYPAPNTNRPSSAGTIGVTHTGVTTVTNGLSIVDGASSIKRRQNSFWTVTTGNGLNGGNYTIKAGGTGFGTVGAISDLRLMRSNNVTGTHGTVTAPVSDFLVQRTGITVGTLSSSFYIGSINDTQTPLPITLISFTGQAADGGALLKWTTSMEKNFDHFEIERSEDGIHYAYVSSIAGQGAREAITHYTYTDHTRLNGRIYYRLKNVDLDGTFDYSNVVAVVTEANGNLAIYPNPVVGKRVTVNLPEVVTPVTLVLLDNMGRPVLQASLVGGEQEILLDDSLKPGIYFARIAREGSPATMIKLWVE